MSISDGNGTEDSTGIIYTYLTALDAAALDVIKDPRMTLTFSEKAIGCKGTAEDPPCARLTVAGNLTRVPDGSETDKAMAFLYSRHPEMKAWGAAHMFKPYWIAKESIHSFFFIDFYGGASGFSVDEWLKATPFSSATEHATITVQADLCRAPRLQVLGMYIQTRADNAA